MNKNKLCGILLFSAVVALCAGLLVSCGKDTADEASSAVTAENASKPAPVIVFFPDDMIKLAAVNTDCNSVTVKGNTGITVLRDSAFRFDAVTHEGESIASSYKTASGAGVGSKLSEFTVAYSLDDSSISINEDANRTLTAVIVLHDDGKTEAIKTDKIFETAAGLLTEGEAYAVRENAGNDFLVLEAVAGADDVVTEFTLTHYTY